MSFQPRQVALARRFQPRHKFGNAVQRVLDFFAVDEERDEIAHQKEAKADESNC